MKKFIFKFFIFVAGCVVFISPQVVFDFFVVKNQYQQNYNASIIDKMERLKSIKEPKIVLVGNSSVAFGFRSELIEKEFNMPVVNLGLHGGLGNAFHEKMAEQAINSGDIIIICHLWYSDDGKIDDYQLAWITIEKHKDLWKLISKQDIIGMLKAYPNYMRKSRKLYSTNSGNTATVSDGCYQRMAFNIYGDNVWADNDNKKYKIEHNAWKPYMNDICINRLNKLNKICIEKNAKLLIAGYPILECEYTPTKEEYIEYKNKLSEKIDCAIISNFEDYIFSEDCFYDGHFHLNSNGAILRTKQLIYDLRKFLNDNE